MVKKNKARKIVTVGILGGRGANNWVVQSIIMCTIGHIIGIWIALLLIAEQRSSTPFFIGKCIALSLLKWKKKQRTKLFLLSQTIIFNKSKIMFYLYYTLIKKRIFKLCLNQITFVFF